MSDFLERVVEQRRRDAAAARAAAPRVAAEAFASPLRPRAFEDALLARRRGGQLAVIAELKRVSPALGTLRADIDVAAQARRYVAAGASAISVLTEPHEWGGSLDDLRAVRAAVEVPLLAKDIVVDASQLQEARAAGADAVLLIAEALDDAMLRGLVQLAHQLGMSALVEAHEPAAFGRAVAAGSPIVGVNARNLRRPEEIDRGRAWLLHTLVRPEQILVAESGIGSEEDARLLPAGVDAVLVGTALMRAQDPAPLIRALAAIERPQAVTR